MKPIFGCLACSSGLAEGEERKGRELRFNVLPIQLPAEELKIPSSGGYTDLLVGTGTIAGKAAAAMAGAMRPQGGGHGKYPVVRAMGSVAVHRAMVAGLLAQMLGLWRLLKVEETIVLG